MIDTLSAIVSPNKRSPSPSKEFHTLDEKRAVAHLLNASVQIKFGIRQLNHLNQSFETPVKIHNNENSKNETEKNLFILSRSGNTRKESLLSVSSNLTSSDDTSREPSTSRGAEADGSRKQKYFIPPLVLTGVPNGSWNSGEKTTGEVYL
eukprot:GHVP01067973.1.p1 GENE.GHVP01067973.1~~GHVP01067973.1.p1  ORF type:complete len:150 (+),score=34.43 GHVP01067973.1:824-1273(+)